MTVIMLAAAMAAGYDMNGAAISDLGVIPETALVAISWAIPATARRSARSATAARSG